MGWNHQLVLLREKLFAKCFNWLVLGQGSKMAHYYAGFRVFCLFDMAEDPKKTTLGFLELKVVS